MALHSLEKWLTSHSCNFLIEHQDIMSFIIHSSINSPGTFVSILEVITVSIIMVSAIRCSASPCPKSSMLVLLPYPVNCCIAQYWMNNPNLCQWICVLCWHREISYSIDSFSCILLLFSCLFLNFTCSKY